MNLPEVPLAATPLSYRGDPWTLARLELKLWLLGALSLGIYAPWGKVRLRSYVWHHVYVGDRPLRWLAAPADQARARSWASKLLVLAFFVRCLASCRALAGLSWLQLDSVLMPPDPLQWLGVACLAPMYKMAGNRFELRHTELHGIRFGQDGELWAYVKLSIQGLAWTALTLGLGYAWWSVVTRRYLVDHSRYGDVGCRYTGAPEALRPIYVWGALASLCTLGAYLPWHIARLRNYHANHTHVGPLRLRSRQEGSTLSNLWAVNLFIVLGTLWLANGWARSRSLAYQMQHLDLLGDAESLLVRPGAESQADGAPDLLSLVNCTMFGA